MNKIRITYLNSKYFYDWFKWKYPTEDNCIFLKESSQSAPILISYIFDVMDFYL